MISRPISLLFTNLYKKNADFCTVLDLILLHQLAYCESSCNAGRPRTIIALNICTGHDFPRPVRSTDVQAKHSLSKMRFYLKY